MADLACGVTDVVEVVNEAQPKTKKLGATRKIPNAKFRVVYQKKCHSGYVNDIEDITGCFSMRSETTRKLNRMCEDIDMQLQVLNEYGDQIEMQAFAHAQRCASQFLNNILKCKKQIKSKVNFVSVDHHFDFDASQSPKKLITAEMPKAQRDVEDELVADLVQELTLQD